MQESRKQTFISYAIKYKEGRFQIQACFSGLQKFEVFFLIIKNAYICGTWSVIAPYYYFVLNEFLWQLFSHQN